MIPSKLSEEKYNTPSPKDKRGFIGNGRNVLTGNITANILKHLQGRCAISGESFASYSADMMQGIHFDHDGTV